ncbi:MAG: alpha/beta fold hydrolase [Acidimicrobiales bacterium]
MLHIEVRGRGSRVVLVHGFTQTGGSWAEVADILSDHHQVVVVDSPGHGRSADERPANLVEAGAMLAAAGGRGVYVGYSMGGRMALHTAMARPDLVRGLVLVGATAGIDSDGERAARRVADEALAASLEADGLEPFLEKWLKNPLFATLPATKADIADRLGNTVDGLAYALRSLGTGTQTPQWSELSRLDMPVLLVVGKRDVKFCALAEKMAELIGDNATVEVVPGAGHAVHLERPEAFLAVTSPFLRAVGHDTTKASDSNTPKTS